MADHFDFYRCAINYLQGNQPMTNVFHVNRESTTAATVITDLASRFASTLGDIISTDVNWGLCTAKEMTSVGIEAVYDMSVETSGHGGEASNPVPPGVAQVITWLTAAGGRSHRGRTYLGGVGLAFVAGDSASWDTTNTSRQDKVDEFLVGSTSDDNVLQVYSELHDSFEPIISGVIRNPFGSQRRRNTP